jgi:hypothetical protein
MIDSYDTQTDFFWNFCQLYAGRGFQGKPFKSTAKAEGGHYLTGNTNCLLQSSTMSRWNARELANRLPEASFRPNSGVTVLAANVIAADSN